MLFRSHLLSLKQIDDQAGPGSLVLIDEVGSGTDPEEGMALAMALLNRLTGANVLTMVTTHHSALKTFAYHSEGVANASMEFDLATLKPTYRFRVGIPGSSYAFEIAKRIGLADGLLDASRQLVGRQKDQLEGLILELESRMQQYQNLTAEANLKETEYRGLVKLYQERTESLRLEERRLKRKAAEEANEILQMANATVEKAIQEIKASQAQTATIRQVKQTLTEQREKVEEILEAVADEPAAEVGEIKVGDVVLWKGIPSAATVLSEPDKRGRVLLQADGLKLKAPLAELSKAGKQEKKYSPPVQVNMEKQDRFHSEIDIRGLNVEEAVPLIELFFDEADMAGFNELRIIHGKGTGKLRTGVVAFLKSHSRVKSLRLGNWNEGSTGVTIVELK